MGHLFEEIDRQDSPIGTVSLRRRRIPALSDKDIYEVKLDDEFLMSSLFVRAEEALAELTLARLEREPLDLVVGGLGLGFTALAALKDSRIRDLLVVDYIQAVLHWHERELAPNGAALNRDPRCRYVQGDFFAMALDPDTGLDPAQPGRRFDAILLDIDHSPSDYLHQSNAPFYREENLARAALQLKPGGFFSLWSNEPPNDDFVAVLSRVFPKVDAEEVTFFNSLQNNLCSNSVYIAQK